MKKMRLIKACLVSLCFIIACVSTAEHRSLGEGIDDSVLLTKVKSKLLAHDEIKGLKINVDVHKGVVTLKGKAESTQRQLIIDTVKKVKGVKQVRSELTVTSGRDSKEPNTVVERDLGANAPAAKPSPPPVAAEFSDETGAATVSDKDEEINDSIKEDTGSWAREPHPRVPQP